MANLNHMMNDFYKFVAGPKAVNQTEQKPWDVAQQPKNQTTKRNYRKYLKIKKEKKKTTIEEKRTC